MSFTLHWFWLWASMQEGSQVWHSTCCHKTSSSLLCTCIAPLQLMSLLHGIGIDGVFYRLWLLHVVELLCCEIDRKLLFFYCTLWRSLYVGELISSISSCGIEFHERQRICLLSYQTEETCQTIYLPCCCSVMILSARWWLFRTKLRCISVSEALILFYREY